jgi:hypothetical protein
MRKQQAILKDYQSDIRTLLAHDLTLKEVINYPPFSEEKITLASLYKFSREKELKNDLSNDKNDNGNLSNELKSFIDKTLKNRSKINLKSNKPRDASVMFKKSLKSIKIASDEVLKHLNESYTIIAFFVVFFSGIGFVGGYLYQDSKINEQEKVIQSLGAELEEIKKLPKDNLQKKEKAKK